MAFNNGQQFASSFGADSTSGFGSQDWEGVFNFDAYYDAEGAPPQAFPDGWIGVNADIGGAPQSTVWHDPELVAFAMRNPGQDRFFPTGELTGPLGGVVGSTASPVAQPVQEQTIDPAILDVQVEDVEMVDAGMPMAPYQDFEQEFRDQIIPFLNELHPVAGAADTGMGEGQMLMEQPAPLTGYQQPPFAGAAGMSMGVAEMPDFPLAPFPVQQQQPAVAGPAGMGMPAAGMSVAQAAPLTGHQQSAVAGPADMARIDSVQPAQPAGEKKGRNREGQRKGWVQATKHHNSRCEGPLACNPDCMLMERFPRTHAKWQIQRFEVQEVGGAHKIVWGLQLNRVTKQEGAKAVGELLANGTVNTRSKTTGGVLADEFWQE